jgi:hypothetical protein
MKHAANVHIKFADGTFIDRTFWEDKPDNEELKVEAQSFCDMIVNMFKDSDSPATDWTVSYKYE